MKALYYWVRRWFLKWRRRNASNIIITKFVKDEPNILDENVMYIMGENKNPYLSMIICPCGCRETIFLNLLTSSIPNWNFLLDKRISIYPSILRIKGCRSHFYITKGRIKWVK